MRFTAHRMRYLLLAGVLLLVAVVAGFFGVAHYRAGRIWQRILARNGVHLQQETDGFTWSQSSKGRTIFTLHASRATPQGHGKWALHNAVLILYGREPGHDDRIYGSEFQYDQNEGVARAVGEVHMDLQAPRPGSSGVTAVPTRPLGFGPEEEAANDPNVIHVRTSGLVYLRKLGVAATGQRTEFRYGGVTCTSTGAEFDAEHSNLRLLADVQVTGSMRGIASVLTADHVEFDRETDVVTLASPVMRSGQQNGRAQIAILHLARDGSILSADAAGAVQLADGTRRISAPQMAARFGQANRPQSASLRSGVDFLDTAPEHPARGTAHSLDLAWRPDGSLASALAKEAVNFQETSTGDAGAVQRRQLQAERVEAAFAAGPGEHSRARLQQIHMTGAASLTSNVTPAGKQGSAPEATEVRGEEVQVAFAAAGRVPQAENLIANGAAHFEQQHANGTRQSSSGDRLRVQFTSGKPVAGAGGEGVQVATAVQTGHVVISSQGLPARTDQTVTTTVAHAETAFFTAQSSLLRLQGTGAAPAQVEQTGGEIQAQQILLHQDSGDAEASGQVAVTDAGDGHGPATHVLASAAQLLKGENRSIFTGEAGKPVQMWQGASQIQAGVVTLDGTTHHLAARPGNTGGLVHAVFASAAPERPGAPAARPERQQQASRPHLPALGQAGGGGVAGARLLPAERDAVGITAGQMDYDDQHHQAVFGGGVRLSGAVGEVTGERGVAFLEAGHRAAPRPTVQEMPRGLTTTPQLGSGLERLVVQGDVHLQQPGRTGSGDQLTYTAATDSFALTGTPAKPPVVTAEGGSVVTGETLLFDGKESRIVVAGGKGGERPAKAGRVHTETELKQP